MCGKMFIIQKRKRKKKVARLDQRTHVQETNTPIQKTKTLPIKHTADRKEDRHTDRPQTDIPQEGEKKEEVATIKCGVGGWVEGR